MSMAACVELGDGDGVSTHPVVDLDENVVWVRVKETDIEVWDIWRVTRAFGDGQLHRVGGWE